MKINITSLIQKLPLSAPVVLRIGLASVYLWFGFQQILHTNSWIGYIPDSVLNIVPFEAGTLVHVNGAFEIVFGFALLMGMFTRLSAFLLAMHMLDITFVVGYTSIGVRDFGLSIATLAIFLYGTDILCMEKYVMRDDPPATLKDYPQYDQTWQSGPPQGNP